MQLCLCRRPGQEWRVTIRRDVSNGIKAQVTMILSNRRRPRKERKEANDFIMDVAGRIVKGQHQINQMTLRRLSTIPTAMERVH